MSFIAKIFIVINLLLAALFCGFSLSLYARRVDYKAKWRDTQRDMAKMEEDLSAKNKGLTDKLTETEEMLRTDRGRLRNTQSELDRKLREYEDLEGRHLEKEEMVKSLVSLGKMKDEELQRLYSRV